MDRQQVNVRLTQELAVAIDQRRIELQGEMGRIPTRSDIIRLALERYLVEAGGPSINSDRRSKAEG